MSGATGRQNELKDTYKALKVGVPLDKIIQFLPFSLNEGGMEYLTKVAAEINKDVSNN